MSGTLNCWQLNPRGFKLKDTRQTRGGKKAGVEGGERS